MKSTIPVLFATLVLASNASSQEKKAPAPHPVTITFYVAGVQCNTCVESVSDSVRKVPSVNAVSGLTDSSGYAKVSFDSHVSSFHQIAQAIAEANPVHGEAYKPTIKFLVPDYEQADNAAKVDAVFKKLADRVTVRVVDRKKGLFELSFLPLKVDAAKKSPQGFNGGHLGHPIRDDAPKGLGLKFSIVTERN